MSSACDEVKIEVSEKSSGDLIRQLFDFTVEIEVISLYYIKLGYVFPIPTPMD